jgi:hypothetical protein
LVRALGDRFYLGERGYPRPVVMSPNNKVSEVDVCEQVQWTTVQWMDILTREKESIEAAAKERLEGQALVTVFGAPGAKLDSVAVVRSSIRDSALLPVIVWAVGREGIHARIADDLGDTLVVRYELSF